MSNEKLQAVYQRNVIETAQIVTRLTERNHALEQVVKEYYGWWKRMEETAMEPHRSEFYREMSDAIPVLQERAKALLEQEVN